MSGRTSRREMSYTHSGIVAVAVGVHVRVRACGPRAGMLRAKTSIILLRRPSRFNRSRLIEPSRSNLRRSWH